MSSEARNDGRRREGCSPATPVDGADGTDGTDAATRAKTRTYVESEAGKLRVFRCRRCSVRVAQEAELVGERPSVARRLFLATFARTFNMVVAVESDAVCCVRCGRRHFAFDARDPALLTLPLFGEEGEQTFDKTAMRCVVMQDLGVSVMFGSDAESKARPACPDIMHQHRVLVDVIPPMYPGRDVEVTHLARYGFSGEQYDDRQDETDVQHYRALYRDAGASFHLFTSTETTETLEALQTQDFALLVVCEMNNRSFLFWTDYNAGYNEACLLGLWMKAGGNVLFGDWWLPCYACEEHGDAMDFGALAYLFGHRFRKVETNAQPAFAQLVRDGHYLGYWSAKERGLPSSVYPKVEAAMDFRLLYARWQFLRDFPPSQFENLTRRHAAGRLREGQDQTVFAELARDQVVPQWTREHAN